MTTKATTPPQSTGSAAAPATVADARLSRMEVEHARIKGMMAKATQVFARQTSLTEVNAILLDLSGFTLAHFREEEELMRSYSFPGLREHKEEHDRMTTYVRGLFDMRSKQEALQCAASALDFWLDTHIRITDKEFCDFVQQQAK